MPHTRLPDSKSISVTTETRTQRLKILRRLLNNWDNNELLADSEFADRYANVRTVARQAEDARRFIANALERLKPSGAITEALIELNDPRWHDPRWISYLSLFGPYLHPAVRHLDASELYGLFALSKTNLYHKQEAALAKLLDTLDLLTDKLVKKSNRSVGRGDRAISASCFLGRDLEIEHICMALESHNQSDQYWMSVHGAPGVGKSALIAALEHLDTLHGKYQIVPLLVGPDRTSETVMLDIAIALGIGRAVAGLTNIAEQLARLDIEIAEKPYLYLIDDVWYLEQVEFIRHLSVAAVVFTTRQPWLANSEIVSHSIQLQGLSEESA